jgi:hypothetical protein
MTAGCRWDGADLVLALRVQPRAARDQLLQDGDRLRARITAPPVDGAANAHLLRFVAAEFGVAVGRVSLVRGAGTREKVVRVAAPARIPASLRAALDALRVC